MDSQNYLGIYLAKDKAAVVCLSRQGDLLGCFNVSVADGSWGHLAKAITEGCSQRQLVFGETAVALDCTMFMQHNLHSEFSDPKQIASTIKFDTEEVLADDITEVAIAYKVVSAGVSGSELAVFTAQRKILSDILGQLQANNIDPVTIEPDINCLSRFIHQGALAHEKSFLCMLSAGCGYFISTADSEIMRTFLIGPEQDRTELLAREIPVSGVSVEADRPVKCRVFDSAGITDCRLLSEIPGIEASEMNLAGLAAVTPEQLTGCENQVEFAIAYGAALAHIEKSQAANFRNDFNPFQGRKIRLQKKVKFLSISVTVLMLTLGLYFQPKILKINNYRRQLRGKFEKDYSAVMLGKSLPAKNKDAVKQLSKALRHTRDVKKGLLSVTGEEAISAKLTLVLEAFNKCAKETDLYVDKISIAAKSINITGSTSSRKNTLKLFDSMKEKLMILQERHDLKAGRDNFSMTVVPKS